MLKVYFWAKTSISCCKAVKKLCMHKDLGLTCGNTYACMLHFVRICSSNDAVFFENKGSKHHAR